MYLLNALLRGIEAVLGFLIAMALMGAALRLAIWLGYLIHGGR